MKKWKHKWPKIKVELPDEAFRQMLMYWDELLKHSKPFHHEDIEYETKVRDAIKVLLEFTE